MDQTCIRIMDRFTIRVSRLYIMIVFPHSFIGLASVCPWAHAKRGNFCIWEILIGVVGVFAGGSTIIMR